MTTSPWGPPDRYTGLPRPNPGPIFGSGKAVQGSTESFPIVVPTEYGPALESYYGQRRDTWVAAGFMGGTLTVVLTLTDGGFGWMSAWGLWVIIGASSALFLIPRRTKMAAGAEWLQVGKSWVNLYDLRAINLTIGANSSRLIELTDNEDRRVGANLRTLQFNPDLWALVYHGLLYSIEFAEINKLARRELFFL